VPNPFRRLAGYPLRMGGTKNGSGEGCTLRDKAVCGPPWHRAVAREHRKQRRREGGCEDQGSPTYWWQKKGDILHSKVERCTSGQSGVTTALPEKKRELGGTGRKKDNKREQRKGTGGVRSMNRKTVPWKGEEPEMRRGEGHEEAREYWTSQKQGEEKGIRDAEERFTDGCPREKKKGLVHNSPIRWEGRSID